MIWLTLAVVAGCDSPDRPPLWNRPVIEFTDGFYLELWILGEQNYAVIYRVNGQKRLGWGGGRDGVNRSLVWAGDMTDEQYDGLQGLLAEHGWFDKSITSSGEPKQRVTRITLRWRGGSRRYTLNGRSDDIEPVEALLKEVARQRLEIDLDTLPESRRSESEDGEYADDPGGDPDGL
jgi:hypothetical protein